MTTLEKQIKEKVFFFKGTRHDCEEEFNKFVGIPKGVVGVVHGVIKLHRSKNMVDFDSKMELRTLLDLDECSYIKEIKTQSLIIPVPMFGAKVKKYIPDIQLLLKDGSIVIMEVKSFKEMVNSTVLRKSKNLRAYCKEHKYGHTIIDRDENGNYYSFEDLKKEKVDPAIQNSFIEFVKEKGKVTFTECKPFKEMYNINDKQICYIIWKNKNHLKYQQFRIFFKGKK